MDNFRDWPWSSYHTLQAAGGTKLNRTEVLDWFGGKPQFEEFHRGLADERAVAALIDEDLV